VRQRFDLTALELSGEPVPFGPELPQDFRLAGFRALSASAGTVAYQVGAPPESALVWFDRSGKELGRVPDVSGELYTPRFDPSSERVAVVLFEKGLGRVLVMDPARNNRTQMTFEAARNVWSAAWSWDGGRIALTAKETSEIALYVMESGRQSSERRQRSVEGLWSVDAWLPGDEGVLLTTLSPETQGDIQRLALTPDAEPVPLVATPANEEQPEPSPDGRWLAYVSDANGRDEVYVRRMDGSAEVWKVSSGGGAEPCWRRDGRELFYVDSTKTLQAVPVTLGASFEAGPAEALFVVTTDPYGTGRQYAVTPDGRRFLVNRLNTPSTKPIVVVRGWQPD